MDSAWRNEEVLEKIAGKMLSEILQGCRYDRYGNTLRGYVCRSEDWELVFLTPERYRELTEKNGNSEFLLDGSMPAGILEEKLTEKLRRLGFSRTAVCFQQEEETRGGFRRFLFRNRSWIRRTGKTGYIVYAEIDFSGMTTEEIVQILDKHG